MLGISFTSGAAPDKGVAVLTVAAEGTLGVKGEALDKHLGGAVRRAIAASSFAGAREQTLSVLAPGKGGLTRLVLVGIGKPHEANLTVFEQAGGAVFAALQGGKDESAFWLIDEFEEMALVGAEAAAYAAFGALLRSYRFEKYRTRMKSEQKTRLATLTLGCGDTAAAKRFYAPLDKVAAGVFLTRDLVSEPPNVIYPETLAAQCAALKSLGLKVEILDAKQLHKLGMGALLGVAQGSERPARLVTLRWQGHPGAKDKRPVAFVGKGVTFDTGGISLKPPGGMEEMKWDMAGAGAVIGAMMALAGRKAKANVVGVVGLVENMPDGRAQRPGDIVTSMSGQTIEVINTDAEGRLVLADALWYAQEKFKPHCIVDLATLTGAIIIALGHEYGGLFANDDVLSEQLLKAGKSVDEPLWRFPMQDSFDKALDSPAADMKNVASGREAGSIMGAQFLQRFVKSDTAWAHLDIAGVAWLKKDKATCPKGASAFGVRLLDRFVAENFEGG